MTQPIQEPASQRKFSTMGFGQEQLFRRPAPVIPESDVVRPWIVPENLGQTTSNNTPVPSYFTDAWFDPVLVTGDPRDDGADDDPHFHIEIENDGIQDYWRLTTKLEGWYTLEIMCLWQSFTGPPATAGFARMQMVFGSFTGIQFDMDRSAREAKDWSTGALNELESVARLNDYRTIYLPASKEWGDLVLTQTSGAARGAQSHMKVWYDGFYGGSDDNADWTFESV